MDDPEKSSGSSESKRQAAVSPLISLPKGGSAIRGTGEKFAANPVTGTGSMSVPLVTSTGHSGFDPLGVVFTQYPTMSPNQKVEYHKANTRRKQWKTSSKSRSGFQTNKP